MQHKYHIDEFIENAQLTDKAKDSYKRTVKGFMLFICRNKFIEEDDLLLIAITPSDIKDYWDYCEHRYSPKTISSKRCIINKYFAFLEKENYVSINPVEETASINPNRERYRLPVEIENKLLLFFEYKEKYRKENEMFSAIFNRNMALMHIYFDTRLSSVALSKLNVSNIAGSLLTIKDKNGIITNYKLGNDTSFYTTNLTLSRNDNEPLFVTEKGIRLSPRSIQQIKKRAFDSLDGWL